MHRTISKGFHHNGLEWSAFRKSTLEWWIIKDTWHAPRLDSKSSLHKIKHLEKLHKEKDNSYSSTEGKAWRLASLPCLDDLASILFPFPPFC